MEYNYIHKQIVPSNNIIVGEFVLNAMSNHKQFP